MGTIPWWAAWARYRGDGGLGRFSFICNDRQEICTDEIVVTTDSARVSATGVEEFIIDGRVYSLVGDDLIAVSAPHSYPIRALVVGLADGSEDVALSGLGHRPGQRLQRTPRAPSYLSLI